MLVAEIRNTITARTEQRQQLLDAATAILAAATISAEQRQTVESNFAQVRQLGTDIGFLQESLTACEQRQAAEERAEAERRAAATAGRPPLPPPGAGNNAGALRSAEERETEYRSAMLHYMRTGDASELRTQQSAVGANGGYSIPTTLLPEVERALLTYGGVASYLNQFPTSNGDPINLPVSDNTSLAATVIGEAVAQGDTTLTMALKQSTVSTLATGIVKLPFQLMQDGVFNWEEFSRNELGESYARGIANYIMGVNTDASFDNLITSVSAGPTSQSGVAVGLTDITNVFGSVDPAYASNGSWVMNRTSQLYLASLRNTFGTPIFPLDATGQLTSLYGRPIVIDTLMPNIAVNNRAILFGNLQKYRLRKVPGFEIVRLNERFAEQGLVAFLGFFRAGGRYIDAGKHPIKALVQAAS